MDCLKGLKNRFAIVGICFCLGLLVAGPAQAAKTMTAAAKITSPLGGATVSGSISITAQISSSVSWVNYYIDNYWVASSPPYTQLWNSATVANGLHKISINAYNSSKVLIASSTITINVINRVPTPTPTSTPTPSPTTTPTPGPSPTLTPGPTPTPAPTSTPTPAPTSTPTKTPTPTPTPTPSAYFTRLDPGTPLPTDAQCAAAASARPSDFEPRPDDTTANNETPTAAWLSTFHAAVSGDPQTSGAPTSITDRITGNFKGTTDQIAVWAACKWGRDENEVRADGAMETWWHQDGIGDAGNGTSLGFLQAKTRDSPSTCEAVAAANNQPGCTNSNGTLCSAVATAVNDPGCQLHLSTAFAVDYASAMWYACYVGQQDYLSQRTPNAGYPTYPNGTPAQMDEGCLGYWNTGTWFNTQAIDYATTVAGYMTSLPWLQSGF
jgi:hypothetical protein